MTPTLGGAGRARVPLGCPGLPTSDEALPMPVYQLQDLALQDLIEGIHTGKVRLPEFQRSFQWQPKARRELLDSIQKGFPVGTLLLMEVGHDGPGPFGQRAFAETPADLTTEADKLVLDGQQRLTTCYVAMRASATKKVYGLRLRDLFERTKGQPGVSVDFLDLVEIRNRPALLDRLLFNNHLLPFEFLTDRQGLRKRLATYRQQLAQNAETAGLATFIEVELEGYLDVFFDYRFPTVVLVRPRPRGNLQRLHENKQHRHQIVGLRPLRGHHVPRGRESAEHA
jgi:hypothetical protein